MKRLTNRVAVVTGAAGGIGRATSERLAAEGCHLALVDVDANGLAETAREVERRGRRASLHVLDVGDRAAMTALPEQVVREHGGVHVLVNNAGVTIAHTFEDHSIEDLQWIIGVNLWGVLFGCKFFLPHLLAQDEAHIVNISSMAGFLGLPMQSSYSATKFAVRGFSESLGAELASTHVGVTAVFPGPIRTKVLRSSRHAADGVVDKLADLLEKHARPPAVVAERIARALRSRQSHVSVGAEAYLTDWFSRVSPGVAGKLLGWGFALSRPRRA
ncbi:MAG TPA: SDR family NAD(P)-dependent oxidoreductase [Polyangiaceae bacterium]|nr:SDR family NAD(P)-dependent oxidoreductase [Polyangiaceae bacterium]